MIPCMVNLQLAEIDPLEGQVVDCKRLAELKLSAVLLTRKQFGQTVQVHSLIVWFTRVLHVKGVIKYFNVNVSEIWNQKRDADYPEKRDCVLIAWELHIGQRHAS